MTETRPVIELRSLRFTYGRVPAVDGIDLSLSEGVIGLVGPNGAGKTTLLSVLAGALRGWSGSVRVAGHDLRTSRGRRAFRGAAGFLPQRFDLAGTMTVADTVRYAAWCHGVPAADLDAASRRSLDAVDLAARARDRVRVLSGGQRQRLGLAAASVHQPRVLLLDEPTVGLDPDQRVAFRGYLRTVAAHRTVLLATHLLEDVRQTADQLVVLGRGAVAFQGSPAELAALDPGPDATADPTGTGESDLERGYRHVLAPPSTEAEE